MIEAPSKASLAPLLSLPPLSWFLYPLLPVSATDQLLQLLFMTLRLVHGERTQNHRQQSRGVTNRLERNGDKEEPGIAPFSSLEQAFFWKSVHVCLRKVLCRHFENIVFIHFLPWVFLCLVKWTVRLLWEYRRVLCGRVHPKCPLAPTCSTSLSSGRASRLVSANASPQDLHRSLGVAPGTRCRGAPPSPGPRWAWAGGKQASPAGR